MQYIITYFFFVGTIISFHCGAMESPMIVDNTWWDEQKLKNVMEDPFSYFSSIPRDIYPQIAQYVTQMQKYEAALIKFLPDRNFNAPLRYTLEMQYHLADNPLVRSNLDKTIALFTRRKVYPLLKAILEGDGNQVQKLLSTHPEWVRNQVDGCYPVDWAILCNQPHIVSQLVKAAPDIINVQERSDGSSNLHWIASMGFVDSLQILLDENVDVNIPDHEVDRPIDCAIRFNQVEAARLLLKHGARVNDRTLNAAIEKKSPDMVRILLPYVSVVVNHYYKIFEGDYDDILKVCIENKSSKELNDIHLFLNEESLLHFAVFHNAIKCIRVLLAAGANVRYKDKYKKQTPLERAIENGNNEITHLIRHTILQRDEIKKRAQQAKRKEMMEKAKVKQPKKRQKNKKR